MKTSIWVKNLDDKLFEITNSTSSTLDLAGKYNYKKFECKENDILLFLNKPNRLFQVEFEVIHGGESKEESEFIIKEIYRAIKEKSNLQEQRRVLKKTKSNQRNTNGIDNLISDINSQLRNEYFEISIKDIIKNFE